MLLEQRAESLWSMKLERREAPGQTEPQSMLGTLSPPLSAAACDSIGPGIVWCTFSPSSTRQDVLTIVPYKALVP